MSGLFFKHEKISAEDYVSVVRHMYVFKTMIHLYNNTFFIKVTDDGLTYSSENGLSLSEIDYICCCDMLRVLNTKIRLMCLKCYSLYIKQFLLVL